MTRSESLTALRRVNPRGREDFARSVTAAHDAVRAQLVHAGREGLRPAGGRAASARRRLVRISATGATLAAAAATVVFFFGSASSGHAPGVESAAAAVERAAAATAASAERSGTVQVRITHAGEPWAAKTVRWSGDDVEITGDATPPDMRVVDGTLYAFELGRWVVLGDPASIDPDSGTTPAEYLAAVRDDTGGATLRRITDSITGLTTRVLADGSRVYRGSVPAGVIARESGFKEGHAIRVLPWGYVAHGEAASPESLLAVTLTVAPEGVVRELVVTWGSGAAAWRYMVSYRGLGETAPLEAPAGAEPLRRTVTGDTAER